MAACPAASSSSRSRVQRIAVAGLFAYLVLVGGQLRVAIVEPELALLSLCLLATLAGVALLRSSLSATPALCLAGLVGLALISSAAGLYPRAGWEATLWQVLWCGFFAAGHHLCRRHGGHAADVLLPAIGCVALVGLLQAAGRLPIEPAYMTEHGRTRVLSTLNHPNNLASYIALVLPYVLARGVTAARRQSPLLAAACGMTAAGLLLAGAATYSRGGQMGIAAGLGCLVVLGGAAVRCRRRTAVLLLVLLVGGGLASLATPLGHRFRLAISGLSHFGDDQRAGTWRAAGAMVASRPLLGVGPGAFFVAFPGAKTSAEHADLFTHAHNWYLHVAAESGVPAAAFLLMLLCGALVTAGRAARGDEPGDLRLAAAALGAGVFGYAVAGLLDVSTGVPAIAATGWTVMGMAWGTAPPAAATRLSRGAARVLAAVMVVLLAFWTVWNRGHAHYQTMLAALCAGEWQMGAEELRKATRLDPGQRAYRLVRADLALAAGQSNEAYRLLQAMDERGQLVDSPYRLMLAHLKASSADVPGALAIMRQTAERWDRAQPTAWTELGWLALTVDAMAARDAFQRACDRHPEQLGAIAGQAQMAWMDGDVPRLRALLAGATKVGLARDRLPRLLVGYGRLDPLLVTPSPHRGRFWRARHTWHGAAAPAIGVVLYEQWSQAQAPR